MKQIYKAKLVTLAALLLTVLVYLTQPGGESYVFITDLMAVIFSLAAVVTGYFAMRTYGFKSLHGKAMFLMLMGMSIWFVTELLWIVFMSPIRMILEALRFAGYVPITCGFFFALSVSSPRFREEKGNIILVLGSFLIFSIAYMISLPIILVQPLIDSILTSGYIVADFAMLFGIALLIRVSLSFRGGLMSKGWVIFILAFLSLLAFDVNFAMNYQTYTGGNLSEVFWLFTYILVSFGFYYNTHAVSILRGRMKRKARRKKKGKRH